MERARRDGNDDHRRPRAPAGVDAPNRMPRDALPAAVTTAGRTRTGMMVTVSALGVAVPGGQCLLDGMGS